MKIAIITGASAGLGKEYLTAAPKYFPEIEEYWLVARRQDKLEEAAKLVNKQCRIFPMDLTKKDSYRRLQAELEAVKPTVALLVNNSGCGFLGNVGEGELDNQIRMIDLNLRALVAVTNMAIPFMGPGSNIINVSSIASFCPNPRMTVYSSSKAFVSSFTVGLSEELKPKGIAVTAVCPGPMKTEFLDIGNITGNSKMFQTLPYCDQVRVVAGTLRAAKAGRTIYTPKLFYKAYRVLAKVTPVKLMVKFAAT